MQNSFLVVITEPDGNTSIVRIPNDMTVKEVIEKYGISEIKLIKKVSKKT